jgi:hypothetical protein
MLRSALSTLVLVLGLPTLAHAYGGDFGTFDFADTTTRRVILGFDQLDNPTGGPAGTPISGFFSLNVPETNPAYLPLLGAAPYLYDAQLFPGQPDNISTGPCLAPAYVVRTQNGFGYCRSMHVIHNSMAQPSLATGTTNADFEAGAIQRYYVDTALDDTNMDGIAQQGRYLPLDADMDGVQDTDPVTGYPLFDTNLPGELPDTNVAGSLNPVTGTITTRPYLERANRLLAGVYQNPAPTGINYGSPFGAAGNLPGGPGYASITIAASDWRDLIDTTGSLITVDPLTPNPNTGLNEVPWRDLRIIFELATGHATMYSTGTVDTSIGRLPFYLMYTTRQSTPTIAGYNGYDLYSLYGATLGGNPAIIPGDSAGVQYWFAADTPLDFFCTNDDPGNGVGPTFDVGVPRAVSPCVFLQTDVADTLTAGVNALRDNIVNMTGLSIAGTLPATTSAGDLSFWEAPEPGTGLLLGAAVAGLALLRRKVGA